jgi:hypothetical protein
VLARVFNITRPSVKVKLFKCRQRGDGQPE